MVETTTDYEELLIQAQGAAMVKFDYRIREHYVEITYNSNDSETLMRIVSGLIFCGFRKIDILSGNIRAYFTKEVALIIH